MGTLERLTTTSAIILLSLSSATFPAVAQESSEELAKKLANPIASLISLPLQNNLDHGIGTLKGSRYTLNVQPVVPIALSKKLNLIGRWVQPIISQYNITKQGEHQGGLGDGVVSAFISPSNSKNGFTWGAGPVFLLPIGAASFSADQWGVGPTAVALKQTGGWTVGALINQVWGSSVSQMFIQPFVTYNWKSGAGLGANAEWTQNWQSDNAVVWLNPVLSGLTAVGNQKVQLAIGPRFNVAAPSSLKSTFGLRGSIVFLFPK